MNAWPAATPMSSLYTPSPTRTEYMMIAQGRYAPVKQSKSYGHSASRLFTFHDKTKEELDSLKWLLFAPNVQK